MSWLLLRLVISMHGLSMKSEIFPFFYNVTLAYESELLSNSGTYKGMNQQISQSICG